MTNVPKFCKAAVARNPGPDYYVEMIEGEYSHFCTSLLSS